MAPEVHCIPSAANATRLRLERARLLPGHFVVALLQPLPLLRVPHDLGLDPRLDHVPLLQRLEPDDGSVDGINAMPSKRYESQICILRRFYIPTKEN